MAFEGPYDFVDYLAEQYRQDEDIKWLMALVEYQRIGIASAKFKDQRHYCLRKIHELNAPFFEGYFKRKKP